jgi:hypothetical protein
MLAFEFTRIGESSTTDAQHQQEWNCVNYQEEENMSDGTSALHSGA